MSPGLARELGEELDFFEASWPKDLPAGVIHADLFPDNVFFLHDELSGLIDFYFACNDALAYDVAICLNAWCFEPDRSFNATKARALLQAYDKVRPLDAAERRALPLLARGAALRFLLTRLYDWIHTPPDALVKRKDPLEYLAYLRFHRSAAVAGGLRSVSRTATPEVEIFTDGACSGNPGPGGWAAILRMGGAREGTVRRRSRHHQQPHGADGGDRRRWRRCKRPCKVRLLTDSKYVLDGATKWIKGWKKNGWKTADKKPVKNVELWQRLDAAHALHKVDWRWVKGHSGHAENERVDELARAEIAKLKS